MTKPNQKYLFIRGSI